MTERFTRWVARHPVWCAALVAVVVAAPSLFNGFAFDDGWIIERRDLIHHLGQWTAIARMPYWPEGQSAGAMWRPLALLGFALQWAVAGGAPIVFHATSILLYAGVCALVAALGARLFTPTVGLVAGVLFAVHPLHVEVTANAVGQAELLAAAGYLGVLCLAWPALRDGAPGGRWRPLAAAALTLLALAAKEHAVTLPGALVVLWWLASRRQNVGFAVTARRGLPVALSALVAVAAYLAVRIVVLGSLTAAGNVSAALGGSLLGRVVVMLPVSLRWLTLLLWPFHLSADYSPAYLVPDAHFGVVHAAALIVWTGIGVLVWRLRDRCDAVPAGALVFVVTASVVSNVVVPLEVLFAERMMFLPSVGWALALGGGLVFAIERAPARRGAWVVALGAALAMLAARSALRAPVWRSDDVLFSQMLKEAPTSFRGHWWLATKAFAAGDSVAGEREMRIAIRLNPDHPEPPEDLGLLYVNTSRFAPAVPLLERALALDSNRVNAAIGLTIALARTDRVDDALHVLDVMTRRKGEGVGALTVRADILRSAGRYPEALAAARRAIELAPERWRLRLLLAETATMAGECALARQTLDAARARAPQPVPPDLTEVAAQVDGCGGR